MSTEELIVGAWGLLSFIALIAWLRWVGIRQDQNKDEPPQVPKRRGRQAGNGINPDPQSLDPQLVLPSRWPRLASNLSQTTRHRSKMSLKQLHLMNCAACSSRLREGKSIRSVIKF